MEDCCPYFCVGLSGFGIAGLLFFTAVLKSGGEWYLGVSAEDAPAAANATLTAAGVYVLFLAYCGMKLKSGGGSEKTEAADDDDV